MNLVMLETTIRQDKEGRYCLNDLHKAAGGEEKDQPSLWLRLDKTKELIEELSGSSESQNKIISSKAGRYGGTYARKEIAIAYAVWINKSLYVSVVKSLTDFSLIQEALNNFEVPDDIPDMYVYAIKNTATGNIKLGISKNPEQRLKQLQTGCDGKLELVAYKKAENGYQDESKLHHDNDQHLIHGEWFTEEAKF